MGKENKLKRMLETWFHANMKPALLVSQIEDWQDFTTEDIRKQATKQNKLKNCVTYLQASQMVPSWLRPHLTQAFISHFIEIISNDELNRLHMTYLILSYHPWYEALVKYQRNPVGQPEFIKSDQQSLELQTCQSFMQGDSVVITPYTQLAGHMLYHTITFNYFDDSVIPALKTIADMDQAGFEAFLTQVIEGYSQVEVPNDQIRLFMRYLSYQKRPDPDYIKVMNAHPESFIALKAWVQHSPITQCSIRTLETKLLEQKRLDLTIDPSQDPLEALRKLATGIANAKISKNCQPETLAHFYDHCNGYLETHHEQLICDIQCKKEHVLWQESKAWLIYILTPTVLGCLLTMAQLNIISLNLLTGPLVIIATMATLWANLLAMKNIKTQQVDHNQYIDALIINALGAVCVGIAYGAAVYFNLPLFPLVSLALTCMPVLAQGLWMKKVFDDIDDTPLPACHDVQSILSTYHLTSVFRINDQYRMNFVSVIDDGGHQYGCCT